MTSALCSLTTEDLGKLAVLRSGRLTPPFSSLLLRRHVPEVLAGRYAIELQRHATEGVDKEQAFVSSANVTEAAQTKNIEAGALLKSSSIARRLAEHFETLADLHILHPVPLSASVTGWIREGGPGRS